jgi:hypothetical protein
MAWTLLPIEKGTLAKQVSRSGMRKYFAEAEIVAEKDAATYLWGVQQFSVDRNDPIVGNSPSLFAA